MNETIILQDLTTGYNTRKGDVQIARNINATLHGGEFTCLLGPNGAGKSTLLKTLCAFIEPLSGHIMIDGTDIGSLTPHELSRQVSVVLTDRLPAMTNTTVAELVGLGRIPYTGFFGKNKESDTKIIEKSLRLVGMNDFATRIVTTLSDGERQKVLIAKALAQQTPVIFLDEPTAFLDYPSKVEMMKLLRSIAHDKGKTVFMSTHDIELALQLADTIWLLDRDKGLAIGSTDHLIANGEVERYFLYDGMRFDHATRTFRIE